MAAELSFPVVLFVAIVVAVWVWFYQKGYAARFFEARRAPRLRHADLVRAILGLDEAALEDLLQLYKAQFGAGAARYARKALKKWRTGKVQPSRQTFKRFLVHLPQVMSYDLKCAVLRRLMNEYCPKSDYRIDVSTNDWKEKLVPLVEQIIEKTYKAQLPATVAEKLHWLSEGDMLAAGEIIKASQIAESKIAVSMLNDEFTALQKLSNELKPDSRITHTLNLSYGTITLNLKRK